MQTAEGPFETFKSKRILSLAYLICFRTQSANNEVAAIYHIQFQWKGSGKEPLLAGKDNFRNRILKI